MSLLLSFTMAAVSLPGQAMGGVVQRYTGTENQMASEPELVYVNSFNGAERSQNFDDHWKFYLGEVENAQAVGFNDSKWREVNLPHDYSVEQEFIKSGEAESGYLPGGTGWYRKNFLLSQELEGKRIRIDFGGVYMNSTVWVNGQKLGTHPYGYTPFSYDITDYVNFGSENIIAVKSENKIPSSRWYSGSGIYRSVKLTVTDPVHVDLYGAHITTPDLESQYNAGKAVTVQVNTAVTNDGKEDTAIVLRHSIHKKGSDIAEAITETDPVTIPSGGSHTISCSVEVSNPDLWTLTDPNLYEVHTEILCEGQTSDTYDTEFGFRWFDFDTNTGFFMNGENMKLKGVCMHHDQGALGAAAYYRAIERQVDILKEMGCNSIRVTHNPADENLIKICNKKGILLIEEAFDTWIYAKNGNINDYGKWFNVAIEGGNTIEGGDPGRMTWAEFDLKSMVSRGKNDPSIIMWSLGNEVMEGISGDTSSYPQILSKLIGWVKEVDTERPVTTGENKLKANWQNAKEMGSVLTQAGGSVGFNYTAGDQLDSYHAANPDWMMYGSETASAVNSRGIYNPSGYELTSYDESAVGWGHVASDAWYTVLTRNYMAGEYVWTGFDYIGEPTPWNGTGSGPVGTWPSSPKSSYFGIVDTAGFPKDSYYLYQSLWNEDTVTLHILPAWNENMVKKDASGKVKVVVYSNAAAVELFYMATDGTRSSLGKKEFTKMYTEDQLYSYQLYTGAGKSGKEHENLYLTWKVPYAEGTLEAVAYDKTGKVIKTEQVKTTGRAEAVRLSADRNEIDADGKDLSYISVNIVDAEGNIIPDADNRIQFRIEGNGEIIGVDNGSSPDHDSYQADNRKAFNGKVLVIIRSKKEGGSFTLTASAEGLASDKAVVTVNEVEVPNTGKQPLSYMISKNYYVKAGNEPVLPEEVTMNFSDGTQEVASITWDSISKEEIETAGTYFLKGTAENGLTVSVNINMIDEIAALLNYSTAVPAGTVPALPSARPAVMTDGTVLDVQFPITWEDMAESDYEQTGTVTVKGTSDVLGKEVNVTASVRVSKEQITIGNNVAGNYLSLEQNIPESQQSDNLLAIVDGSIIADPNTSGGPNPSVWTDWQYAQNGGRNPQITFTFATAQNLGEAKLYFFKDAGSVRMPEHVELYYSLDPTKKEGWNKIEVSEKTEDTSEDRVTCYTYSFAPVNAVGLMISITDASTSGTSQKPCTGITEVELKAAQGSFRMGSTAKLNYIKVNDEIVEEVALNKGSFSTQATVVEELKVEAADNAAVTVLPVYENEMKIILESEDHNKKNVFTLRLDSDSEDMDDSAEDDSRDYPYAKTTAEVSNFQPGYPAGQAIDDDESTIWHTLWAGTANAENRWILLALDEETMLDGFRYLPKQGSQSGDNNGRVGKYRIDVSTDKVNWSKAAEGTWEDTVDWKLAKFSEPVTAKYVRLYGLETYGAGGVNKFMNAAELRVRKTRIATDLSDGQIIVANAEYKETGAPVKPNATVTLDGNLLRKGIDYKLTYANNTNPGTATVTATGILKYRGTLTAEFTIVEHNRQNITIVNGSVTQVDGEAYDGGAVAKALPGKKITIKADEPQEGVKFDHWKTVPETLSLADRKKEETTFTVPDSACRLTAVYVSEAGKESMTEITERILPEDWFAYTDPDDLEMLSEHPSIVTEDDKEALSRGDRVRLIQTIERKERTTASASNAIRDVLGMEEEENGKKVGYYVATNLKKSVSRQNGAGTVTETMASPSQAIKITMELPAADREMADYKIIGYEKDEEDGFAFEADMELDENEITFTAKTNGLFAVTYTKCYTVTFMDHDNQILAIVRVPYGEDAPEPEEPQRTGYTFTGWSKSLEGVTKDMTVKAIYEKIVEEEPEDQTDFTALNAKIREVEKLLGSMDKSKYTTTSVAQLEAVLKSAKVINENASQKEVDTALAALKKAINALTKRPVSRDDSGSSSSSGGRSEKTISGNKDTGISSGTWQMEADGKWKVLLPSGETARNQWLKLMWNQEAKWFHFGRDGCMEEGWLTDTDGSTYYLHTLPDGNRGYMYTGWNWIVGEDGLKHCYYFNERSDSTQGRLLKDGMTPDGYRVNADGQWVVENEVQIKK